MKVKNAFCRYMPTGQLYSSSFTQPDTLDDKACVQFLDVDFLTLLKVYAQMSITERKVKLTSFSRSFNMYLSGWLDLFVPLIF